MKTPNIYLPKFLFYRDNSFGIATGWTAGVRFPAGLRDFSLLHSVQPGSGAHPTSYTPAVGAGGALYPGVKPPVRDADHLILVPRSRMVKLYLHSLTRLHGVVRN
jgi:hypothetical protein